MRSEAELAGERPVLPRSLWADTAVPACETPRLEGDIGADVAIVGAGFAGLCAALELAAAGRSVAVLDAVADALFNAVADAVADAVFDAVADAVTFAVPELFTEGTVVGAPTTVFSGGTVLAALTWASDGWAKSAAEETLSRITPARMGQLVMMPRA